MATKKPPKARKHPKKPKTSAPLSTWEKYDARCKQIDKENAARLSAHKKAINGIATNKKRKEALIKKHQK